MKKNVRKNVGAILLMLSLCGVGTAFAQDVDLMVCSNKGYKLKEAAAATSGSTYQWYENGTKLDGQTSTELTMTAGLRGTGVYKYVRMAGSANCPDVPSNTFTVEVVATPAQPTVPNPEAVCEGTDVIFAVTSPETGATYSWTWTETEGTPDGTGNATYTVSGAAYGTKKVQATASIYYTATAGTKTKTCVSIESDEASATVKPLPVVEPNIADYEACGGGIKNLKVIVTAGSSTVTDEATITWYEDNSTGSTQLTTGATYSPTLTTSDTYYVGAVLNSCASTSLLQIDADITLYQGVIEGDEL
jgi:hypothetical protein